MESGDQHRRDGQAQAEPPGVSLAVATVVALVAGSLGLTAAVLALFGSGPEALVAIDFNAGLFEDFLGPYWSTARGLVAGEAAAAPGYIYPSTLGWLVAPAAALGSGLESEALVATSAAVGMIALSLVLLLASLADMLRPRSVGAAAALGAVVFLSHGALHGIYWAQASLPAAASMGLGCACLRRGRYAWAGAAFGFGCALKLYPAVGLVAVLARRPARASERGRALLWFVVLSLGLGIGLPMALMGQEGFLEFHRTVLDRLREMSAWVLTPEGCRGAQDLPAVLARLSAPPWLARGAGTLVALGLVGLSFQALRGPLPAGGEDDHQGGRRYAAAFVFLCAVPWAAISPTWPHGLLWIPAAWWLAATGTSVVARIAAALSFGAGSVFALGAFSSPETYAYLALPAWSAALALIAAACSIPILEESAPPKSLIGPLAVLMTAPFIGCQPSALDQEPRGSDPLQTVPDPKESGMEHQIDGYDFDTPDLRLLLPGILKEVSAIATLEDERLCAVQDELGSVFVFDPEDPTPITRIRFGPKGDYEGLTSHGTALFVLRSDGTLFELEKIDDANDLTPKAVYELDLPHDELEGVALDPDRGALLMAPKGPADSDEYKKSERPIYAFDLETRALLDAPAYTLSRKTLQKEAEAAGLPLPKRETKSGKLKPDFDLSLSDLAVHPISGHHYFLDGPARLLFATTPDGALLGTAVFPEAVAPQPEGLAFSPDGSLYLASEAGDHEHGTLLRFPWTP